MINKFNLNDYDFIKEAKTANDRIKTIVKETPVEYSYALSKLCDCQVYLKLENLQISGSFKIRGATNFILDLKQDTLDKGLVTTSSGNHAAAVSYLFKKYNIKGTIYMPENASTAKIDALQAYDPNLEFFGTDVAKTEQYGRDMAEKNGLTLVPPYNHPRIIAGQATIALELQRQLKGIDSVIVPIGGGGLMAGIAGYLKQVSKNIEIIGCLPQNSPVMYESVKAGKIIEMESKPTISDGTAGGIEKDAITFDICRKFVDDYILISEEEIKEALKIIIEKHHMLIEGSAALTVAALIKTKKLFKNKKVVLIISGKRIGLGQLKLILCEEK